MNNIVIVCAIFTVILAVLGLSRAWTNNKQFKKLLQDASNGKYDDIQRN